MCFDGENKTLYEEKAENNTGKRNEMKEKCQMHEKWLRREKNRFCLSFASAEQKKSNGDSFFGFLNFLGFIRPKNILWMFNASHYIHKKLYPIYLISYRVFVSYK